MIFSVKKFRHYLLLNLVVFFVDHMALRYLVNKLDLSGRLACWILLLEKFDYTVEYKPGCMHKQANHLFRISKDLGSLPLKDDLPYASLFAINVVPTWYNHIAEFLSTQQMPLVLSKIEHRKICVNIRHFALIYGHLYRRSADGILRQCVTYQKVLSILEACHDSVCGGHFFGRLTTQKALCCGYFWPTMFTDAHTHAQCCDACQRYARNDLHMDLPLHLSLPLVPFEKWGIDFIGQVYPSSSRGMKYIIIATEYFRKMSRSQCRNPTLAKCGGEAQHLEKVKIWSPPGLPNVQSSTTRPKTPCIGMFLVSLERS